MLKLSCLTSSNLSFWIPLGFKSKSDNKIFNLIILPMLHFQFANWWNVSKDPLAQFNSKLLFIKCYILSFKQSFYIWNFCILSVETKLLSIRTRTRYMKFNIAISNTNISLNSEGNALTAWLSVACAWEGGGGVKGVYLLPVRADR